MPSTSNGGVATSFSKSGYENLVPLCSSASSSTVPLPGSPRTRIKTVAVHHPVSAVTAVSDVNEDYYQGGGEDLFATNKTKEQLYIEAKDILNAIGAGVDPPLATVGARQQLFNNPDYINVPASPAAALLTPAGSSPGSTHPRRPPRSKHDRDPSSPEPQVQTAMMLCLELRDVFRNVIKACPKCGIYDQLDLVF